MKMEQHPSEAKREQENTPDQNNSDQEDLDDQGSGQFIEKWMPTVEAISAATEAAFPSSPRGPRPSHELKSSPNPNDNNNNDHDHDAFRRYWHDIFTDLLAAVAADPTIPDQLTQPPTARFHVNVFDRPHGLCCPCLMPDVEPSIALERAGGVRKTDLVRGVRDFLYGGGGGAAAGAGAGPVVYRCDGKDGDEGEVVAEPLLYTWDWMSGGDDENGERVSYYYVGFVPRVFAYACRVGEYEGKQKLEKEIEGESEAETEKATMGMDLDEKTPGNQVQEAEAS